MFKVNYYQRDEEGNIDYHSCEILTVYNINKDMFLVYVDNCWKWIPMNDTEPYIKGMGI
jgi:hypothetical protein